MDPKSILNTLKEASPFDIFLVSFLLLPFVVKAWVEVIDNLSLGLTAKYWGIAAVIVCYFIGVIIMLTGTNRERRREIARDQIIQYLTAKNYEMMSYERVQKNINKAYSNEFLDTLVTHFPNHVRKAKLKGGKEGIARIIESNVEVEA
jgi:hypothetical protein